MGRQRSSGNLILHNGCAPSSGTLPKNTAGKFHGLRAIHTKFSVAPQAICKAGTSGLMNKSHPCTAWYNECIHHWCWLWCGTHSEKVFSCSVWVVEAGPESSHDLCPLVAHPHQALKCCFVLWTSHWVSRMCVCVCVGGGGGGGGGCRSGEDKIENYMQCFLHYTFSSGSPEKLLKNSQSVTNWRAKQAHLVVWRKDFSMYTMDKDICYSNPKKSNWLLSSPNALHSFSIIPSVEAEAVHSEDPSSPPSPPPPSVATVPAVESAVGVVEGPVALCCCGSDEGTLVAAVDVTGCACWLDSASPSLLAELACAREVDVQGNYYNTEILQHIHNIQLCHNVMSKKRYRIHANIINA